MARTEDADRSSRATGVARLPPSSAPSSAMLPGALDDGGAGAVGLDEGGAEERAWAHAARAAGALLDPTIAAPSIEALSEHRTGSAAARTAAALACAHLA